MLQPRRDKPSSPAPSVAPSAPASASPSVAPSVSLSPSLDLSADGATTVAMVKSRSSITGVAPSGSAPLLTWTATPPYINRKIVECGKRASLRVHLVVHRLLK